MICKSAGFVSIVVIPSLTIPPPQATPCGIFLKEQIPQLSRTKKVWIQDPQGAKTPPLGQLFSKIQKKYWNANDAFRNIKTVKHIKDQSFLVGGFYGYSKYFKSNRSPQEIHKQVTEYDFDKY